MKSKTAFLLLPLVLLMLTSCQKKQVFHNESFIFGTVYHITYTATDDLQTGIDAELAKFDASLSMFNPSSTISRFNRSGLEPFDLSGDPWTKKVIEESLKISAQTNGAFDITVAPLVNLWGFGTKDKSNPTPAQIDSIRSFVGYKLIHLEDSWLTKSDPRVQLDCSAVAKGYACDVVADYLSKQGVDDFLVEIGGEMVLKGKNPEGNPWRIGINKPVDDSTSSNQEWEQRLALTDKAIATSGNYRKFYVKDGKKLAHTIDPLSGYPVQHSLLSATIVAPDCLTADALATACMVIGVDSAMSLVKSLHHVEALFIYNDDGMENKVLFTAGIPAMQKK
jgi:FAD:protein FMN transferase